MDKEQRWKSFTELVARMHAGQSWQEAVTATGIDISQSTAYRLSRIPQKRGKLSSPASLSGIGIAHPH